MQSLIANFHTKISLVLGVLKDTDICWLNADGDNILLLWPTKFMGQITPALNQFYYYLLLDFVFLASTTILCHKYFLLFITKAKRFDQRIFKSNL